MTISYTVHCLAIIIFYTFISSFGLFEKAGRKKWEAYVPVYNIYIWLKIIKQPWWWGLILLVPGWNVLLIIGALNVSMGRIFNKFSAKDTVMQIVLPFIYFPMLAKDKDLVYADLTDWNNDKQRNNRKISDQIALLFASFGIINVLVQVFKLTGSKDKPGIKSMVKEWGDSIVFALIAASMIRGYVLEAFTIPTPSMEKELLVGDFLFVNKLSYGTRVPFTPLSFPLAHNTIPFTYINSYSTAIKLPYYRLPGFGKVKRNDIVVFNHPVGDTAVYGRFPGEVGAGGEMQGHNYFQFVRNEARNISKQQGVSIGDFFKNKGYFEGQARNNILVKNSLYGIKTNGFATRPIDKKENYIKRCVAVGGDVLEIRDGQLYINDKESNVGINVNYNHFVDFNRTPTKSELDLFKENYGFNLGQYKDVKAVSNTRVLPNSPNCIINMSKDVKAKLIKDVSEGKYGNLSITSVSQKIDTVSNTDEEKLSAYQDMYPNHENFNWTIDNYGPIWMPKKGETIELNKANWIKYQRCIAVYEGNKDVVLKGNGVYIDGKLAKTYTFKQDYYYMVGDNRHNSADSRAWGFVPEDHVVGKGLFVWMSKDLEKGWFSGGIRWGRIFKTF